MKVQPIYTNKILKKGLEFAADNSALFIAATSLTLSTVVRPLSILGAPQADKENKKLACAKSIASSLIGYLLMLGVSLPVARGVKRIDKNPAKFLKSKTIKSLKGDAEQLQDSKGYQLATQMFKLGLGALVAFPKAALTSSLIPPVMSAMFDNKRDKISFKGRAGIGLSKGMGKVLDTNIVQKPANKFKDTNFVMHAMAVTDTFATWAFIHQSNKNPKIDEARKKVLNYNAAISTGLCIAGGYALDKVLEKPTKTFVKNFQNANRNDAKLGKYLEGIKIVKPALVMGAVYYGVIPFVSTILAEKCVTKKC